MEHSIYTLGNITLPVPIHPYNLLYFVAALMIVMGLTKVLPEITVLPVVIRYLGIPYGITVFLRKKKLDGKNPIKYFKAYIIYLIETGMYFEHFKGHSDKVNTYKIDGFCSIQYHRH